MKFYEIKLNFVIDRNPRQALKHLRSALEEIFDKNRHLNSSNVNLLYIEENFRVLVNEKGRGGRYVVERKIFEDSGDF